MTGPPEGRGQPPHEGDHLPDPAQAPTPASAAIREDAWVSAAAAFAARVRELTESGQRSGGEPPIVAVPADYRAPAAPAFAHAEGQAPALAPPPHESAGDAVDDPLQDSPAAWHPAPASPQDAVASPEAWGDAPAPEAPVAPATSAGAAAQAWAAAPARPPEPSVAHEAWPGAPAPVAWPEAPAPAFDADASAAARFAAAQGGQAGALAAAAPSPPVTDQPSDFATPAQAASEPLPAPGAPVQGTARASAPLTVAAASRSEPAEAPLEEESAAVVPPASGRPMTRRERFRAWRFAPVVEIIATVALALALAESVQAAVIKPFVIPSQSMEPTLLPGQRVLVNRLAYDFGGTPARGDIVVFHPPSSLTCKANVPLTEPCPQSFSTHASDYFVKRVIGLPGDTLSIKDGHPVIDGRELTNEPYITPCSDSTSCNMPHAIVIPAGYYYMLGDNRGDSDDSRYWGPVPLSWIIGEVFATYWPLDRIGFF